MQRPRLLLWLVTARCNLACSHCYAARFAGQEEMAEREALQVIREAARAGVRHVGLSGGEPFLKRESLSLIEEACRLGMSVSAVSNGSPLTEKLTRHLAGRPIRIVLSIDGANRETHERIRGPGSWRFVIRAAQNLRRHGIAFSTVMAVSKFNHTEVTPYLSLAKGLGALGACLIPVMPSGRAATQIILDHREMASLLREVEKAAEDLRFPVSLWCTPFARLVVRSPLVSASPCRNSLDLNISPNGDVLLCDILDHVLSNTKEKGVLGAWWEQEENPLVKALAQPRLQGPCGGCPLSTECLGGCFSRAQLISGDLFAPDPLCPRIGLPQQRI